MKTSSYYAPTLAAVGVGTAISLLAFFAIRGYGQSTVDVEMAAWSALSVGLAFTVTAASLIWARMHHRAAQSIVEAAIHDRSEALSEKSCEIAERKNLQTALDASEQRFRDIMHHSKDPMLLIENNLFIDCNDAAVKTLGYPDRESFLATAPDKLSPAMQPDGRSSKEKADEMSLMAVRQGFHRFEWTHQKANGETFPIEVTLTAIPSHGKSRLLCVWRDVSKQKEAERALRASERLYRLLVQNVSAGITMMDTEHTIVSINAGQCRMFDKPAEAFHGKKCYREFEKRDAPCAHCPGIKAMETGNPASVETKGVRDNGSSFVARVSAYPVVDEDGKTTGFVELVEDVTDYRKAQEALAEEKEKIVRYAARLSEANQLLERRSAERRQAEAELAVSQLKYKTIFELSNDAIMIRSLDRRVHTANQAAVAMFGCKDEDELRSMKPEDIYAEFQPDGARSVEKAPKMVEAALRDGFHAFEWKYKRKNGTEFLANVLWTKMELEGKPYLVMTIRDITEQRRIEEERRLAAEWAQRENAKLTAMISGMEEGVAFADADNVVIEVNDFLCRFMGRKREEIVGKRIEDLHQGKELLHLLEIIEGFRLNIGASSCVLQRRIRDADVILRVQPIYRDGKYDGVLLNAIDVTELAKAHREAKAAVNAKNSFLAAMSHDMRTTLNAVAGMTELLFDTNPNEEQREYLETIRESGEDLLSLVNDALDFARIEADTLVLDHREFNVQQCVEDAMDAISPAAAAKQLKITFESDPALPRRYVGDAARVRQILYNLLHNAVKFTAEGKIDISLAGGPCGEGHFELEFTVRDTGIGVSKDQRERLFQTLGRIDPTAHRRFGGAGLGLTICQRLSGLMGGRMWVESTGVAGQGAAFHFTVRLAVATETSEPVTAPPRDAAILAGKKVLIVDDNRAGRDILVAQTKRWKMVPTAAASGQEAIDLIDAGLLFDLAILDMQMPKMDGVMLAGRIKAMPAATAMPLVLMSSLAHRMTAEEIALFAARLVKPTKAAELCGTLCAVLGRASKSEESSQPGGAQEQSLHVLLAEDSSVNQRVVKHALDKMGHRVDMVTNGQDALDALQKTTYDAVLMDCRMPILDGYETTRRIRQREQAEGLPRTRIIAITAHALEGDRDACLAAGMDDYLGKPVRAIELQRALDRIVAMPQEPAPVLVRAADSAGG